MMKKRIKIWYLYLTVFVTGVAVLIIEILGTRVVGPFFGETIFVWSSLIIVTLSMLALGYWLGGVFSDKHPSFTFFYSFVFIAGVLIQFIMKFDQPVLVFSDSLGLRLGPLAAAAILFGLPLFVLGAVTPFAIKLSTQLMERIGRRSGSIFAFSTVGSLVGAILAGFVLLPYFSLTWIFAATGLLVSAAALVGGILFWGSPQILPAAVIAIAILAGALYLPASLYQEKKFTTRVMKQEQSFYGNIKIVDIAGYHCLVIDGTTQSCRDVNTGKPIFGIIREFARIAKQKMGEQGNNFRMLILGLGGGDILAALPQIPSTDVVEIDPKVVEVAKEEFNLQMPDDVHVFVDDARHFLLNTSAKYDLIISDLWLGNKLPIYLYSQEALRLLSEHLQPNGLVVANIDGRISPDDRLITSILKTAEVVFPKVLPTALSPKDTDEQSLVVHFSMDENYAPVLTNYQAAVGLNLASGKIVTDAENPLSIFGLRDLELFRDDMVNFGGYKLFFGI